MSGPRAGRVQGPKVGLDKLDKPKVRLAIEHLTAAGKLGDRHVTAIAMRAAGATNREIAEQLGIGGANPAKVIQRYVNYSLRWIHREAARIERQGLA
jgi:hypothetical protein